VCWIISILTFVFKKLVQHICNASVITLVMTYSLDDTAARRRKFFQRMLNCCDTIRQKTNSISELIS
jgi:hypothetical protein